MRLLLCLIASVLIHAMFFQKNSENPDLPHLVLSLEPKNIDLKIRARVKRKEVITPQEVKEVPPPPPPQVKKKIAKKIKKKEVLPKNPQPKKPEPIAQERAQNEYVSQPKKPRMIARAEYLSNPPPKYPRMARKRMLQGTVTLLVEIDSSGSVKKLRIQQSSGSSILDRSARDAVSRWRFTPGREDGEQVASEVIVPVKFELRR